MIHIVVGLMLVQAPQIGSLLSDTVQLVYESGGIRQAPWIYESVRVRGDPVYDRCVSVVRRAQPERETCVRGDTLFERNAVGSTPVPLRPVGPNMRLEVATPAGNLMEYTTGHFATRSVAGASDISVIATTIVTRDSAGKLLRRLREEYAPAMLTAVWGIFEVPDGTGGWLTEREFSLHEVQYVTSEFELAAAAHRFTTRPGHRPRFTRVPRRTRSRGAPVRTGSVLLSLAAAESRASSPGCRLVTMRRLLVKNDEAVALPPDSTRECRASVDGFRARTGWRRG